MNEHIRYPCVTLFLSCLSVFIFYSVGIFLCVFIYVGVMHVCVCVRWSEVNPRCLYILIALFVSETGSLIGLRLTNKLVKTGQEAPRIWSSLSPQGGGFRHTASPSFFTWVGWVMLRFHTYVANTQAPETCVFL